LEIEWNDLNYCYKKRWGDWFYILKSFFGFISLFLSFIWVVQIFNNSIYYYIGSIFPFLDFIFFNSDHYLTTGYPFISTILYFILTIHLILCTINGFGNFSKRIPFFTLAPLKLYDTYVGSLLINCFLLLITSFSMNHLILQSFYPFAQGTQISLLFNYIVNNTNLFRFIFNYNIQIYIFLANIIILGIINIICFILFRNKSIYEEKIERLLK